MMTDVHRHAHDAGLSPLLTRIAVILSDIEGEDSAESFIKSVQDDIVHPLEAEEVISLKKRRQRDRILEA